MESKGKYYLTTAIAYTSGKPHIGNTYEIVLADSIARYKREVAGTNLVLPVPDIAYCNRVLKKIAAEVGIDKTITYHLARHTFATTNALAQGIRIEVVSRMLGHTNIKTTQIYAKVTDDMLAKGFDEMADIYSAKYSLAR